MPDDGRKLISDVMAAKTRRAPDVVAPAPPVSVRVEMVFQRMDGVAIQEVEPEDPQELEAGAAYTVVVTLRTSKLSEAVEVSDNLEITLKWHSGGLKLPIDGHGDPVRSARLVAQGFLRFVFTFDIPKQTPVTTGELLVKAGGFERESVVLRRRAVNITGQIHAAPKAVLEDLELTLQPDTGPELASLHIGETKDGLEVIGYHPSEIFSRSFPKPKMSLADVDGEKPSRKVHQAVSAYGQSAILDLLAWLNRVLVQTGQKVSIVIVERTDSRVPWEMLVLENETPPLGARVLVTRWTDVPLYKDKRKLDPTRKLEHVGSVLHFVDEQRLARSGIEVAELRQCKHVDCKDVDELNDHLEDPPADLAMLFLSCHGTFAQDGIHHTELAAAKVAGSGITPLHLVELKTPATRPAIVVNACHSARIARTDYGLSGLPNFFLAKYASSYFGTLGAVDEEFAAELGRDLIKAARSKQGVNLAQFLFDVRKTAWDEFNSTRKQERNYWAFVSAFMYVLYGPVQNHMQLLPEKADGK